MNRNVRPVNLTGRSPGRPGPFVSLCLAVAVVVSAVAAPPDGPATRPAVDDEPKVDAQTAETIDGALKWLASKQLPNGAFTDQYKVAYTGYVLMAFMAGGSLPDEGPYGQTVRRALDYLLQNVRGDGFISAPEETGNGKGMYGHGIATIALGELYGQTHDARIRPKLQRAVKLICDTQNAQGGWRYNPEVKDADLSVTVLQVVAIRAAINDGLEVPASTVDRAVKYVKSCRARGNSGGFAYQPGGEAGFARTAAAIYSLQVCGIYKDNDKDGFVADGSRYLIRNRLTPQLMQDITTGSRPLSPEQTRAVQDSLRWFTYGNFYAAPAQYMIGGDTWKDWYETIRTLLASRVRHEGDTYHWPTLQGDGSGGSEIYVTAVDTMILAMPYHYIPLYQK